MGGDVIVLKFGGSVLRSRADVPTAVHEIYRWYRAGWRVVALAATIGDQQGSALLGIALDHVGVPAGVVDPQEVDLSEAEPGDRTSPVEQLRTLLEYTPVLVLADSGYGIDDRLRAHGCGGSDPFAVYLANALRASRCRLLKDVDGIYESDPAAAPSSSLQRFSALGYADALEFATTLIQPTAVQLLDQYSARAEVAAIASPYESVIGRFDRTPARYSPSAPTNVLILGLGDIGGGIYQRVAAMNEHFNVIGALVRERDRHRRRRPYVLPLFDSIDQVLEQRPDVIVDALPGCEPSHSLLSRFLERGISVVSCNFTLVSEAGLDLRALAARCNAYLRYDAAIGGSAPMIEALRREAHHGDIRSIGAVFSGAASHLLDRSAKGFAVEELLLNAESEIGTAALREELSGATSVHKLRVLSRHAFGRVPDAWRVEAFDVRGSAQRHESLSENCTLRLVARAWKIRHRVFGQLQLEALDTRDPLAQVQPEWNRLLITRSNARHVVVQGRGAGRWPVTEALMADLLDVRFAQLALTRRRPTAP